MGQVPRRGPASSTRGNKATLAMGVHGLHPPHRHSVVRSPLGSPSVQADRSSAIFWGITASSRHAAIRTASAHRCKMAETSGAFDSSLASLNGAVSLIKAIDASDNSHGGADGSGKVEAFHGGNRDGNLLVAEGCPVKIVDLRIRICGHEAARVFTDHGRCSACTIAERVDEVRGVGLMELCSQEV